jgi:hypothetical protein
MTLDNSIQFEVRGQEDMLLNDTAKNKFKFSWKREKKQEIAYSLLRCYSCLLPCFFIATKGFDYEDNIMGHKRGGGRMGKVNMVIQVLC